MTGGLDFYSAAEARSLLLGLLEAEPSRLVIDARDAFVDSSGIGVLVLVAQRARLERRDYRLSVHSRLADILRMHSLDELLGIGQRSEAKRLDRPHSIAA